MSDRQLEGKFWFLWAEPDAVRSTYDGTLLAIPVRTEEILAEQ